MSSQAPARSAAGSVGALLTRTFAVLVALIVMSGAAGIAATEVQVRSVRELDDHVVPMRLVNAELRGVMTDGQRALRGYLLTADARFLEAYEAAVRDYPAVATRLEDMVLTSAENTAVTVQLDRAEAWWALAAQQRLAPPRSDQAVEYAEHGKNLFDAYLAENRALDATMAARAARLGARAERLRRTTVGALVSVTVLATVLAVAGGAWTRRRITRPLGRLVTVLGELGEGRFDARVPTRDGPAEVRAVGEAVNLLAAEIERTRHADRELSRLRLAARRVGTAVRSHLSEGEVLAEAGRGLGEMLDAEHVVIRLAGGTTTTWCAPGATGPCAPLAEADAGWLLGSAAQGAVWVSEDVRAGTDPGVPEPERRGFREARASGVVSIVFGNGTESLGVLTMMRAGDGRPWDPVEIRMAESVAADLGHGLHQARLYETEQELVSRLKEIDDVKTDFMSTVSHELRTPLTSIAGYVEMLQDEDAGPLNTNQAKMLGVIARNTSRLRGLIEDLLILSRIEAGTFRASRGAVDLTGLISGAYAAIGPAADKSGVSLSVSAEDDLGIVADRDQIDRVLSNLLSNAVKFTPSGGAVTLTARRDGDEVQIEVADTGMGIPAGEQDRLFTRFFRASNANHLAVPGTGLGLTIVRTIVRNHGGTITAVSEENVGTTVTVRLPAGEPAATGSAPAPSA
ncbi:ATP-binding protein [Catenuloplanes atrovinosus]|uniref:histidine kinase n=1 Tax=Catenuloplanes atrovinosus TaxID=137266 RepID=A0AAE3YSI4_9ACTN|nr:ATP-binding protein [Catenuloplanes atrovinosus]MDR7277840.1 signal transduction histidine kinase/CHASE3 domain sensor protein [Catenuloplanes atrovinosus]